MNKPRIGVVNFLNALPLWESLRGDPEIELVPEMPSRLASLLSEGAIDAGLLPVIEYFRQDNLLLLPDVCISADGPVKSVLLFHRKAIEDIQSVQLDPNSRTSNTLTQVILKQTYGLSPHYESARPNDGSQSDAFVVIGDPALEALKTSQLPHLDLAKAWKDLTGLPFVFAAWLMRKDTLTPQLANTLLKAASKGQSLIAEIAGTYAPRHQLDKDEVATYLKENIAYTLGAPQHEGLALFGQYAAELGLADQREITFYQP